MILDDGLLTVLCLSDPEFAPERLNTRDAGFYKARVRIPRQILNIGRYRIRVGISTRFTIYDVVEDVTFEVVDNIGIMHSLGRERKYSMLSVQLPWMLSDCGRNFNRIIYINYFCSRGLIY